MKDCHNVAHCREHSKFVLEQNLLPESLENDVEATLQLVGETRVAKKSVSGKANAEFKFEPFIVGTVSCPMNACQACEFFSRDTNMRKRLDIANDADRTPIRSYKIID